MEHAAAFETSRRQLAAIELESEIDANRANRRLIADPDAGGGAKLAQVQVGRLEKHVARIDERDSAEAADERGSKLAVQNDESVATGREPGRADRRVGAQSIEREPANRGVAAGKKSLARRKVLDDVDDRLPVRPEDRP